MGTRRQFPAIGLVMEGGGAKGAFSQGFASECHRLGIRFRVVSGTSVGGLGAWIVATGQYDVGDKLWPDLKFSDIYSPLLAPWKAVAALLFLVHAFSFWTQGLPPHMERASRWNEVLAALFRFCVFMPLIAAIIFTLQIYKIYPIGSAIAMLWMLSICLLPLWGIWRPPSDTRQKSNELSRYGYSGSDFNGVSCFLIAILTALFLICVIVAIVRLFMGIATAGDFAILAYALAVVVMRIAAVNSNLADTPLTAIIDRCLDVEPAIPCFVTTARAVERWTPDDLKLVAYTGPEGEILHGVTTRGIFLPKYHNLKRLPPEARRTLLRATAALPFGLVSSIQYDGETLVDGGMADNLPILPLLRYKLDLIVVVRLSPAKGAETQEQRAEAEARRAAHLLALPSKAIDPGVADDEREIRRRFWELNPDVRTRKLTFPKLHVVCPDEDLGGLLDFSNGARKLEKGREAARAFKACVDAFPVPGGARA